MFLPDKFLSELSVTTIGFEMPYYHVYIEYKDKKGNEIASFLFNRSEGAVKRLYARPYKKNRAFLVGGKIVHRPSINKIEVFKSTIGADHLILPDGKPVRGSDNTYTVKCFERGEVEGVLVCTEEFISLLPEKKEKLSLMESASFLGLDANWSLSTCALQLQEVAITLVAKRKGIKLEKTNVERILNKKIEDLSFNDQYEAFKKQIETSFNIKMPILPTHLRKMRALVLHEPYNPKPEETDSIVGFTIGLLKKLKDIS